MSRREEDFTVGYTRRLGDYARKFKAHKHPDPFRNRPSPSDRTFMLAHASTFIPATPYQVGLTLHVFDTIDASAGDLTLDGDGQVIVGTAGVYRTLAWAAIQSTTASSSEVNDLRIEYNGDPDYSRTGHFEFNCTALHIEAVTEGFVDPGFAIRVLVNNGTFGVRPIQGTAGICVERIDA